MKKKKSLIGITTPQWHKRFERRGYRKRGTPTFPLFWPEVNENHNVKVRITIEEL